MIRRTAVLLFLTGLAAAGPAAAQDAPMKVMFVPTRTFGMEDLNGAITAALSQPPFVLVQHRDPGALIVAIEDPVELKRGKVSGNAYSFKVSFLRDGASLGESYQSCNASNLAECTDQILADIKTATAPR